MKKRKWTSEQKLQIVMQGVKGRAVSEICNEYQIGQSQYYLGRDQFLQNAGKVFEMPQKAQQQSRLERENERLKAMVGAMPQKRYCWRIQFCQPFSRITLANNGCRVFAIGTSCSQLLTLTKLIAVAETTCCKCVFACPM